MMHMCRVFQEPNGNLRILHCHENGLEGESEADRFCRICEKAVRSDPTLAGLPYLDVPRETILALGRDHRADRHRWRLNADKTGLIVDASVPDLPHPKQALLDEIQAAKDVATLKRILSKMVTG